MKKTVGVLGSDRGVGVTQLCIALANFISLESGRKVQLLDVSGTGQLARVPTASNGTLFGVKYIPDDFQKISVSPFQSQRPFPLLQLILSFLP